VAKKVVKSRQRDAVAKPGAKRGGAKSVPTKNAAPKRAAVKRAGESKMGSTKSTTPQRGAINEKNRTPEPIHDDTVRVDRTPLLFSGRISSAAPLSVGGLVFYFPQTP
jgi:hypothetical protein